MRLLVTADIHYNHPGSRRLADELIERMNRVEADVLLVVGDTAASTTAALEQCLSKFRFAGPKLFVAGNHELWTAGGDSYELFRHELPRRVRSLDWHWLEDEPFVRGDVAIVGSIGWYDYSLAPAELGIPRRFYQHKVSPGAALQREEYEHLLERKDDISPAGWKSVARWNDGRFVRLGRSDEAFLDELTDKLDRHLSGLAHVPQIVAAIHHIPFVQMLPPPHNASWDFAKAYLGSPRLGEVLLKHPNVRWAISGHTHLPLETTAGPVRAVNIGSGYRTKRFRVLEL